jgi:hypothetical protein
VGKFEVWGKTIFERDLMPQWGGTDGYQNNLRSPEEEKTDRIKKREKHRYCGGGMEELFGGVEIIFWEVFKMERVIEGEEFIARRRVRDFDSGGGVAYEEGELFGSDLDSSRDIACR